MLFSTFFSLRGLVLDTKKGNILKLGKDGYILRWVTVWSKSAAFKFVRFPLITVCDQYPFIHKLLVGA